MTIDDDRVREAKAEALRRALGEIKRRDYAEYVEAIRGIIVARFHDKQREVYDAILDGLRFIALCCSRRAGKTHLLASLIVLRLLDAGFKQAVVFAAPTKAIGKALIWADVAKMVEDFGLDWDVSEHTGEIKTPKGATFHIIGLDKAPQVQKLRGLDIVMMLADESQVYEHLLKMLMTSVGPALTGRKGVFVAAGTPGYTTQGYWYDLCFKGAAGFVHKHWDLRQNTKNPRPGDEILAEVRQQNSWTELDPEYQREYLGLWVEDANYTIAAFSSERNSITELPDNYGPHWKHVIGIDYGFDDAIGWVVIAANPYGPERVYVHAEKYVLSGATDDELLADEPANITARLVEEFGTTYAVCDFSGGGKTFFKVFNAKYGKKLGCQIRGANKVDKDGRISLMNTELRSGRLTVLRPAAEGLAIEFMSLRWKDEKRNEVFTTKTIRDDLFDAAGYAFAEIAPWVPREEPKKDARREADAAWRQQCKVDPEAREIELRNKRAREQQKSSLWGRR